MKVEFDRQLWNAHVHFMAKIIPNAMGEETDRQGIHSGRKWGRIRQMLRLCLIVLLKRT